MGSVVAVRYWMRQLGLGLDGCLIVTYPSTPFLKDLGFFNGMPSATYFFSTARKSKQKVPSLRCREG